LPLVSITIQTLSPASTQIRLAVVSAVCAGVVVHAQQALAADSVPLAAFSRVRYSSRAALRG
jgi:hypothetical protein